MKKRLAVFDLDGTLCPHAESVSRETARVVEEWAARSDCVLMLSTATPPEGVAKRARELEGSFSEFHCCHGNVTLDSEFREVWRSDAPEVPEELLDFLRFEREMSSFDDRGEEPFYHAHGCTSFSVLGKRYTREQREAYVKHDARTQERTIIAIRANEFIHSRELPFYALRGGVTGIDVFYSGVDNGYGKARPLVDGDWYEDCVYFGDDFGACGGDSFPLHVQAVGLGDFIPVLRPSDLRVYLSTRTWRELHRDKQE